MIDLKTAQDELATAYKRGELYDIMYWRGVIDGMEVQKTERHALYDLQKKMRGEKIAED